MPLDYTVWVRAAKERLAALENQRQAIDTEMAALEQSIRAFEPLVNMLPMRPMPDPDSGVRQHPAYMQPSDLGWLTGQVGAVDIGFTAAVRAVIQASNRPLEPTEIRDLMVHNGFDLSGRPNAMATVHQVLRRLVAQRQIKEVLMESGKTRYIWGGAKITDGLG